ncbi:TetR/AcrR family transcriptional regulator [Solibacillus silvestris]|uniref:TetR/AcrR family transcriptional regulator n=1 Tax=Solibacillus silvestris TaxID=76853 RepID=UPI003F8119A2
MATRGRPKGASGEESRALLLQVAAKEFAQNGYYGTKISTIVKGASLTQPVFYLYFQNKEAVFQELVDLFRIRLVDFVNKSRLEPALELNTVQERVTYGLANLLRFFSKNPDLTRIGFYISADADEIKKQLVIQIKENLDVEVSEGYFRTDFDTHLLAECLVGIIERLTFTQLLTQQKDPEAIANDIVKLFLYGIMGTGDGSPVP